MLSRIFLVFFLFSTPIHGYAQKNCEQDCACSVSGQVVDATNDEPIPFASVQIKGTSKGAITDEQGKFIIEGLCHEEFDILASHIGYKSVIHHHDKYHKNPVVKLAPDEIILESIVVEDQRAISGFNSAVETKVESKELAEVKSESLGEVLDNISGVSTLKTGQNVVKPIIHGLHSNRILIINNGVRHESQDWGDAHAPEIDPSLADNISMIKGASAVKYGPNALGGVVVIDPPKMELRSHLHGDISLKGESNGRALDGDILLQKGYQNFAWMVQAAGRYQGDLTAPDYELTNTGMRESSFSAGALYHWRKVDLKASYSHVEQKLGVLRGSVVGNLEDLVDALNDNEPDYTAPFSYNIGTPRQEVSHDLFKLESNFNWANSQLNLIYGLQINKRQEFDIRRGGNNERPSIDLELSTHTFDAEWIHGEANGWEGSIGFQGFYQDNNNIEGTNTIPFVPNYNNSRFGLYISESRPLNGSITLELGLRYDYQQTSVRGRDTDNSVYKHDQTFQSVSGIVGIEKSINAFSSFRMNLASAWRPPNIAEMYSYGKHRSTIDYGFYRYQLDENGDLQTDEVISPSEININNELGLKWIAAYEFNRRNFRVELSPYVNYVKNFIYKTPRGITNTVRGPFPFFIYEQASALLAGVDGTVLVTHGGKLKSKFSGSYLWAQDTENDDVIFGMPANRVSYKISHTNKLFKSVWENSLEASYTFKQSRAPRVIAPEEFLNDDFDPFTTDTSSFDFTEAPDGYPLLNFSSRVTIDQLVVGIRVKNLLNTSYREYTDLLRYFADQRGINFQLSLKYQL